LRSSVSKKVFLFTAIFTLVVAVAIAQRKVTLQLKWSHGFQFAGYYAAKEQGYYRDAGLDVEILEANPSTDPIKMVLDGKAQYAVGTSSLILERSLGKPFVVLAVIFQHSPYEIYSSSEIVDLRQLAGKRLMIEPQSDELLAFLKKEGVPLDSIRFVPHSFDPNGLMQGKAEAISGYISNEPYYFRKAGYEYHTFSPRIAGIDFYGDNLFTTEQEIKDYPERVKAFRDASLKGWQYAQEHRSEIIELIYNKYSQARSTDYLYFESEQMIPLLRPDLVEIGYMNINRWRHIASVYAGMGQLPKNYSLDGFIYKAEKQSLKWFYRSLFISFLITLFLSIIAIYIYRVNRRLKQSIEKNRVTTLALSESEELWRTVVKTSPDGIAISTLDGIVLQASDRTLALLGLTSVDEVIGRDMYSLIDESNHEMVKARIADVFNNIKSGASEILLKRKDGEKIFAESNVAILRDALGNPKSLIHIVRDISQRRQSEILLKEAERQQATLISNLPGFVYRCKNDPYWTMEYLSDGCEKITGYKPADFIERVDFNYSDIMLPEYREPIWQKWQKVIAEKKSFKEEYPVKTASGEIRWLWEQGRGIYDANGELLFLEGFITDVTKRKQAEDEILQFNDELEKRVADRTVALELAIKELEAFSYSASHDLRTPLRAVNGYANMLLQDYAPALDDEGKRMLHNITESANRMGNLIDDLLSFSRLNLQDVNKTNTDMEAIANAVFKEITSLSGQKNIQFIVHPLPECFVDPSLFHQVWVNLIGNAIKFTSKIPEPRIEIGFSREKNNAYFVKDNGVGFDQENASRLFGLFKRIHSNRNFDGTGIGLAIVKRIIQHHKGEVWAEGKENEGATFYFTLPQSNEK